MQHSSTIKFISTIIMNNMENSLQTLLQVPYVYSQRKSIRCFKVHLHKLSSHELTLKLNQNFHIVANNIKFLKR